MTDMATEATATEVTQGEPPTLDGPTVKPGYLTTEFWQTNLVHLFAAVSSMLVFLNVNIAHLTMVQGLIPMVAIGASLIAQTAYNNKRANVKIHQITKWGEVNVAHLSKLAPLAPLVGELISTDPALGAKIGTVEGAAKALANGWVDFPSSDATPAVEAPVAAPDAAAPTDVAPADAAPTEAAPAATDAAPADVTTADPVT